MEKINLKLPHMYGDHHIIAVRDILLRMPGVKDVFASGSLQTVQVSFDPAVSDADALRQALSDAGYTEALSLPVESGLPAIQDVEMNRFPRHTDAYAHVNSVVSFSQTVKAYSGRALWPCPGLGGIGRDSYEDDVGDG